MTIFNYEGIALNLTIREIVVGELYQNPEIVRDVRMLGYNEHIPYTMWIEHIYRLSWRPRRIVVNRNGDYAPPNLDIMLPSDKIIDSGGYDKFNSMIGDRFRTAFETPVPFYSQPYFHKDTLEFWSVISTVLAAAYPEVSENWTSRRNPAANDNIMPKAANDNEPTS